MSNIIDVSLLADEISAKIKYNMVDSGEKYTLCVLSQQDNPGIKSYHKQIVKACNTFGIEVFSGVPVANGNYDDEWLFDSYSSTMRLDGKTGILIPLPISGDAEMMYDMIRKKILPEMDVDRISSVVDRSAYDYNPATVDAVLDIIEYSGINVAGKSIVVVGRSENLGLQLANELTRKDAVVTVLHSKVIHLLSQYTLMADIIISVAGRANLFSVSDINDDAVVIDVGCSLDGEGKLSGDFNSKGVENTKIRYTPVPGGVGKITTLTMLSNLVIPENRVLHHKK